MLWVVQDVEGVCVDADDACKWGTGEVSFSLLLMLSCTVSQLQQQHKLCDV